MFNSFLYNVAVRGEQYNTGMQSCTTRGSIKVLMITSRPIPLISPQLMPTRKSDPSGLFMLVFVLFLTCFASVVFGLLCGGFGGGRAPLGPDPRFQLCWWQ